MRASTSRTPSGGILPRPTSTSVPTTARREPTLNHSDSGDRPCLTIPGSKHCECSRTGARRRILPAGLPRSCRSRWLLLLKNYFRRARCASSWGGVAIEHVDINPEASFHAVEPRSVDTLRHKAIAIGTVPQGYCTPTPRPIYAICARPRGRSTSRDGGTLRFVPTASCAIWCVPS